jgi:glycosyltransferase involved in cell wall biosynthesis
MKGKQRIAIDYRLANNPAPRGIGNYIYGLVDALMNSSLDYEVFLYIDRDLQTNQQLPPNFVVRRIPSRNQLLADVFLLPVFLCIDRIDLFHATANTPPPFIPTHIKIVTTIHDTIYLDYPDQPLGTGFRGFVRHLAACYRRNMFPIALKRSSTIITISKYTESRILHWRDKTNVPDVLHIKTIHQGLSPLFIGVNSSNLPSALLDSSYFLHFGSSEMRKNTQSVIKAFASYRCTSTSESFILVIAGFTDWHSSEEKKMVEDLGLSNYVYILLSPTVAMVHSLYKNAIALIYASLSEGFGIPILEAFYTGCPILLADSTCLPEIAGSSALYFNPYLISSLVKAMQLVCTEKSIVSQLVLNGSERLKRKYSWASLVEQYISIYGLALRQ